MSPHRRMTKKKYGALESEDGTLASDEIVDIYKICLFIHEIFIKEKLRNMVTESLFFQKIHMNFVID